MDEHTPAPDWPALLAALEARLEDLAAQGVGWLSIAGDAELRALLGSLAPPPAEAGSAPPPPGGPSPAATRGPAERTSLRGQARRLAAIVEGRAGPPPADAAASFDAPPPHGTATRGADTPPADRPAPDGTGGEPAGTEAPPPPAELDSLEALQHAYRDCRKCKLAGSRNRLVFGVGSAQPRLLFIGEGPGADEDRQGLPFVGRAGRLLTGLIAAMGLVRDDVYITNVVKCRPPGNRNPEPDEVASCRTILQRQIELLNPALIVSLGNVPLKVLNPSARGITSERGRVFHYGQWRVLPTFHPSYLLRNPAAIPPCWSDFRKALELTYEAP